MEIRKNYVVEITKEEQKAFATVAKILRDLSDEASCFDDALSQTELLFSIGDKDMWVAFSGFDERVDLDYLD